MTQNINDLPKEVQGWLAEAELGIEAERFAESKVGRYMLGRARQVATEAYAALAAANPDDAKGIRALQNEIRHAENFKGWLIELIEGGRNAEVQIQTHEAHTGE